MTILEAAQAECPPLHQFSFYGPLWRDVPLLDKPSRHKVSVWWPSANELQVYMGAQQQAGLLSDAWNALTGQIADWFSRGAREITGS